VLFEWVHLTFYQSTSLGPQLFKLMSRIKISWQMSAPSSYNSRALPISPVIGNKFYYRINTELRLRSLPYNPYNNSGERSSAVKAKCLKLGNRKRKNDWVKFGLKINREKIQYRTWIVEGWAYRQKRNWTTDKSIWFWITWAEKRKEKEDISDDLLPQI
jgi:hypothetical protein